MEPGSEPSDEKVEFDVASASARIIARAIDLVMILAVTTLITGVLVAAGVIDSDELENATGASDTVIVLSFLAGGLSYEASFIAIRGKTLGKVITRSKLISTSRDGPPRIGAAIARTLVWMVPVLVLDVIGLAITFGVFVWVFFDSNRQGLHDKIANTYVVVDRPIAA